MLTLRALPRTIPLLLVVPALAGCATSSVGGGSYTGAKKEVVQAISNLQSDSNSRNLSNICNKDLASNIVAKLGASQCQTLIGNQLNEVDNYDITVENVVLTSKTTANATVKSTYNGNSKKLDTLHLTRQGSDWKVSGLD
jgi:hypothetical protein